MDLRKIFAVLAVVLMIPIGTASAMPGTVLDTSYEYKMSGETPEKFLGFWDEELVGKGRMNVTPGDGDWYGVEVSWARSAYQVDMWTMSVNIPDDGVFEYRDCIHYLLTYGVQYLEKEDILYENGTGRFIMNGGRVTWIDDQDHVADNSVFVKSTSPNGGGL